MRVSPLVLGRQPCLDAGADDLTGRQKLAATSFIASGRSLIDSGGCCFPSAMTMSSQRMQQGRASWPVLGFERRHVLSLGLSSRSARRVPDSCKVFVCLWAHLHDSLGEDVVLDLRHVSRVIRS
jgi:hypothetical protein